jgi:flagellar hook-length control protein FliK
VARAIHTAQERGGPLQLRLSPPELGAMRLELSVNQGALTASIETDNSTARQVLLDNLPALRDRLAEQNVKIERFDVDVRRDSSGSQQNSGPQDRGAEQRHDRTSERHGAARRETVAHAIDEAQPIRRTITNTSINVVA